MPPITKSGTKIGRCHWWGRDRPRDFLLWGKAARDAGEVGEGGEAGVSFPWLSPLTLTIMTHQAWATGGLTFGPRCSLQGAGGGERECLWETAAFFFL